MWGATPRIKARATSLGWARENNIGAKNTSTGLKKQAVRAPNRLPSAQVNSSGRGLDEKAVAAGIPVPRAGSGYFFRQSPFLMGVGPKAKGNPAMAFWR